jgi:hypothetical protein
MMRVHRMRARSSNREQVDHPEVEPMTEPMSSSQLSKELAQIALAMQSERTGHTPKAVTVVASEETVVLTLHEAARSPGRRRSSNTIGPCSRSPATNCGRRFNG